MNDWRSDDGSTMPFILGLVAIVMAFAAVCVDLSYIAIERERVAALADDVALAAAVRVDLLNQPTISTTKRQRLALSSREAKDAAAVELSEFPARDLHQRKLEKLTVVNRAVRIMVSARARPPFTWVIRRAIGGDGSVTIRASAAAATFSDPRR